MSKNTKKTNISGAANTTAGRDEKGAFRSRLNPKPTSPGKDKGKAPIPAHAKRDEAGRAIIKSFEAASFRVRLDDESLPVTIPLDRLRLYSEQLGQALQNFEAVEAEKQAFNEQIKGRLSEIQAKISNLKGPVATGREFAPVKVKVFYLNSGEKVFVRLDTRDIIRTEAIQEHERQLSIFGDKAKNPPEKPKTEAEKKAARSAAAKAREDKKRAAKAQAPAPAPAKEPTKAPVPPQAPAQEEKEVIRDGNGNILRKWADEDGATLSPEGGAK